MQTREERNALFRQHHYRWRKGKQWVLIGPDGQETSEQAAVLAIRDLCDGPLVLPQHWAQSMLGKRPLILDTETSGLEPFHEVIELAVVELDGSVVLNTLIQCQGMIPADATKIHGITKEMLISAPSFSDVWADFSSSLDRDIIIFNAGFDIPMLRQTAARHHIAFPRLRPHCLMIQFYEYARSKDSNGNPRENYRSLDTACQHFAIPKAGHRALSDAQAAREVLLHLAAC